MMNVRSKLSILAVMAMLLFTPFALTSCSTKKGPVESAGEEVDEAVGKVKDSAKEAGEEIKDEYDDATTN